MRLTGIEARELLSYDTLRLSDLPQTLVVVGPNGAGKTNLLVLLEVVLAAVDRSANFSQEAYQALLRYAGSRRLGAPRRDMSGVRLGIALTEPWERELLVSFVRAAVASSIMRDTSSNWDASASIEWIREHVNESVIAPLSAGNIVVELVDVAAGTWEVSFEFGVDGQRFVWTLEGTRSQQVTGIADARRLNVPSYGVGQKLDLDEQHVPRRPFTMSALLPPAGEARTLTLEPGTQWAELTREFAALADIPLGETQRRSFSLASVLHVVLGRGLALLGDLREPPRPHYTVEDVAFDPSPTDGSRIPARLFRLKNGSAADRSQFSAIQDLFMRLTGRTFDVTLATTTADQGGKPGTVLRISAVVDHHGQDLAVEFVGAGIWEALLLSATLPASAGRVAVLNEPARNLHPTLQRRLLTEIQEARGQFILTTHSPYLMPPASGQQDDVRIVRFGLQQRATRARHLRASSGADSARLRKALGESTDARALLFARGVVLVEGGTELGALPEWFAKSPTAERLGTPDALNVMIFSVDGDPGFETYTAFLHAFGVPWAIVCDGAVYRFGTGKRQVFEQVLNAGVDDSGLREAVVHVAAGGTMGFAELRDLDEDSGIFTLAEGWDPPVEGFEAFLAAETPGLLADAARAVGRSKPRQGRYVAAATECPEAVDTLYGKLLSRLRVS